MHSYCYVVLPKGYTLDDDPVRDFVRKQMAPYYIELEVEPYRQYFSESETLVIAERKGSRNLMKFGKYLDKHGDEEGVENGRYYWITTFNPQGYWDYYSIDEIVSCREAFHRLPTSMVGLDGIWHCDYDFGYAPILDFD
jgi:hypothetical protein